MSENRSSIPAEIKRKVLVEAGHRCAIHTCRYIETEIHHIIPWETCQEHAYENLIALCANCHRRADRGEIDRKALRIYKANLQYLHEKYSQLEMDILFELFNSAVGSYIPWPSYLNILIKRILDSGYVEIKYSGVQMDFGAIRAAPDLMIMTDEGRNFIEKIASTEIE